MLRAISFIALAVIASGVMFSFKADKEKTGENLGI